MGNEKDTTVEEETYCDGCGYEGAPVKKFESEGHYGTKTVWLCDVCANTATGNIALNGTHYDVPEVLRAISYATNLLLAALKRPDSEERRTK